MSYKPMVSSIEFRGSDKTKDYIIEREIHHQVNTLLDSSLAKEDRDRLDNLGLFSEVRWQAIPLDNGTAVLQYSIIESIQKTPPVVLPAYDEKTGWSLNGFWIIQNFRGRNQQLSVGGSIGARDSYGIGFSDPWMFGNHVSLDLGMGRTFFEHLFLDRSVKSSDFHFKLGRWHGEHVKMIISAELADKRFSNLLDTLSFSYIEPQWNIAYDTRDIFWNPGKGFHFHHYFSWKFDRTNRRESALIWKQSYSTFIQLGSNPKKLILAMNITANRRWGGKHDVWLKYFGGSHSVRGWPLPDRRSHSPLSQSFRFGHEYVYTSLELRKDIIPKFATSYKIETGLSVVGFVDVGLIGSDWSQLPAQQIMAGTGFGIRIPFPMIDAIRLDLGWGFRKGKWNSPAIHWGIAQKF